MQSLCKHKTSASSSIRWHWQSFVCMKTFLETSQPFNPVSAPSRAPGLQQSLSPPAGKGLMKEQSWTPMKMSAIRWARSKKTEKEFDVKKIQFLSAVVRHNTFKSCCNLTFGMTCYTLVTLHYFLLNVAVAVSDFVNDLIVYVFLHKATPPTMHCTDRMKLHETFIRY